MALDIISIVIAVLSLVVSGYIWYSDKKSVWYWNIVLVPIQETFKSLKKINLDDKEENKITILNRYCRNIKDYSDFLEISVKSKKVLELKEYIENQFNKITVTIMSSKSGGNYIEVISNFEIQLYKKIAKLVLKK